MDKNNIINRHENGIKVQVKVLPNSSKCEITGIIDNAVKIKLDVPPVEGKANEKLIKFLSKVLNIPKTSISISGGEVSRNKVLFIQGNPDELSIRLKSLISIK